MCSPLDTIRFNLEKKRDLPILRIYLYREGNRKKKMQKCKSGKIEKCVNREIYLWKIRKMESAKIEEYNEFKTRHL